MVPGTVLLALDSKQINLASLLSRTEVQREISRNSMKTSSQ